MKFAYKRFASGIERPIIPIIVRNPATGQSVRYLALVDSGADECIFAGEIGELIGLAVSEGRERTVSGVVAGQTRPYYVHDVEIEVGGWRTRVAVGFMPDLAPNGHGLLGQTGFFDLFSFVKFERPTGTIELGDILPVSIGSR
ncbi:MAG TPA: aspartyl protease family protein [Xanthobacteraceae bacterium]|nr:aspartyl protease family protein [Xanthobacteraceae bacterium]